MKYMNIATELVKSFLKFAGRKAVSDRFKTLTYDELYQKSARISTNLNQHGISESCIAIITNNLTEHVVCMLGIILSGNYYLSVTRENLPFLQASSLPVSLLLHSDSETAKGFSFQQKSLAEIFEEEQNKENFNVILPPETNLCAFFTSGSTSSPKIVIHNHQSILQDTQRQIRENHISCEDKIDFVFSPGFSASLACIFPALLSGAELCLFDLNEEGLNSLIKFWEDKKITFSTLSVSMFESICMTGRDFKKLPLRFISISAEPVKENTLKLFHQNFPAGVCLQIAYASTETRTISEFKIYSSQIHSVKSNLLGSIADGKKVYILSEDGIEMAAGSPGEIVVASPFIANEYFNNPEETLLRFNYSDNETLFRTGDLGYLDEKKQLYFLGRKEEENKLNGIKINLKLIENSIESLYPNSRAIVVVHTCNHHKRLVAFIEKEDTIFEQQFVRDKLQKLLPPNHIPSAFVRIASWPLTHSGKINRKYLESADPEQFSKFTPSGIQSQNQAEVSPLLQEISTAFCSVLDRTSVQPDDDFFALGGDSLRSLLCTAEIESLTGMNLPNYIIYSCSTPLQLTTYLQNNYTSSTFSESSGHLLPERKNIYIITHYKSTEYDRLIHLLSKNFNVLMLYYDISASYQSENGVDKTIQNIISGIDRKKPGMVMGFSFNGYLAHYIASVLKNITHCIVIDTPNYFEYEKYKNFNPAQLGINLVKNLYRNKDLKLITYYVGRLFQKKEKPDENRLTLDKNFIRAINTFTERLGYPSCLNNCIYFKASRTGILNNNHGKGWKGYTLKNFHLFEVIATHSTMLEERYEVMYEQILRLQSMTE